MGHKFYRKEIEEWEEVEHVLWEWRAIYKDNTNLLQYGDDGIFHQTKEIDQSRLEIFIMENIDTHQRISIEFPEKAKLFFQYQNAILNAGSREEKRLIMFIFGYEGNYFVIDFDNNIIFTNDYKKVL